MIQAFQQGNSVDAAHKAVAIDIGQLDPEQVAGYQSVIQQLSAMDAAAADIIARADNHRPREGSARTRVTAARAAKGNTGIPRSWMIIGGVGGGLILAILLGVFMLGRATSGGSADEPIQPVATAEMSATSTGDAAIANTSTVSETGSVLLTGDMRLKVKALGAEAELTPSNMVAGDYSLGGQVIGTISVDAATGGMRLSYSGTVPVSVTLFKVDPALPPVQFSLGNRAFTVLAQTDGMFHLITLGEGGKDWGTFAPPESIDIGNTRITTADVGDSIELTFPAMTEQPAPTAPAGNG
jgi:hypothetical protein